MRLLCRKSHFLITVGTILLLIACEKDELEPTFSDGVLKGTVWYYDRIDTYYGPVPLENVTVKANGPYGSRTALTNANGEYEMNHMGNGTYEIEFLKKGWGATKFYSVRIFGNEELTVDQRIWKYPEFAMPVLDSKGEEYDAGWVAFRSNLPESTTEIPTLRAFFSKSRDVSCFKYEYSDDGYYYTNSGHLYYYFNLYPESQGETVFIVAYICDGSGYGEFDQFRGLEVYPSINPEKHSQVIEYKIP
jgi:hypothetical protein